MMIDTASKVTSVASDDNANMFIYSPAEVEQDASYFTFLEDEVTRMQHFVAEPDYNGDFLDGTNGFETFSLPEGFDTQCFSCTFEYDQIKFDPDALDMFLTKGEERKGGDDMLQGTDEKALLGSFCLQSGWEEALLDTEPNDKVSNFNYGTHEESCLGNLALSRFPHFQEIDCVAEKPNLSSERVMVPESTCDKNPLLLDQMTVEELREIFTRMFGRETSVVDKQWLEQHILFGLQSQGVFVDDLKLLECGKTFKVSEGKANISSSTAASSGSALDLIAMLDNQHMSGEKQVKRQKLPGSDSLQSLSSLVTEVGHFSMDKANTVDALAKQMRMRTRPRRCIEGPEEKSRHHYRKCGTCCRNSRDKFLHFRSHKQHRQKGIGAARFNCQENSFKESSIQVAIGLPVQKGKSKENTSFLVYDSEDCKESGVSVSNEDSDIEPCSTVSQDVISEDDCITRSNIQRGGKRRRCHVKRHRRWTPSEVTKLIEGVSQFGVGKWTQIKKLLFSSSSHRTSVNLKDKWRNLLKASCNQMLRKGKVEQGLIQASNKLPESVLRQVRELAVVYSCARQSKSNDSCNAPVASLLPATIANSFMPSSTAVGR